LWENVFHFFPDGLGRRGGTGIVFVLLSSEGFVVRGEVLLFR
jgi:hypothetical protein